MLDFVTVPIEGPLLEAVMLHPELGSPEMFIKKALDEYIRKLDEPRERV